MEHHETNLPPEIIKILSNAREWRLNGHDRPVFVRYKGELVFMSHTALGGSKHHPRRVSRTVEHLYNAGCTVEVHTYRGVELRRVIRGKNGTSHLRRI